MDKARASKWRRPRLRLPRKCFKGPLPVDRAIALAPVSKSAASTAHLVTRCTSERYGPPFTDTGGNHPREDVYFCQAVGYSANWDIIQRISFNGYQVDSFPSSQIRCRELHRTFVQVFGVALLTKRTIRVVSAMLP